LMARAMIVATVPVISFILQGCGGGTSDQHVPPTTIAPSTTTGTTTTTTNLVDYLNALYNQEEDGVFMRVMKAGYEEPWLGGGTHTSWAIFNKFAWDTDKKVLTMFGYGLLFGMIAKPGVRESMAHCMYPCDGGTNGRSHNGCGCYSWFQSCAGPDGDWCGPTALHQNGHGFPCALHPNETARLLKIYKDAKAGKGPMAAACQSSNVGPNSNAWTEVDIDTDKWNAVAHESIQAFVIPNECEANDTPKAKKCWNSFWAMWKNWKARYPELPVVRVNRTDTASPFSVYPMNQTLSVVV